MLEGISKGAWRFEKAFKNLAKRAQRKEGMI
jgi:hypothetical protein